MTQKIASKLPPLNALRTFEVAARYASFKDAADELCVTQAAVSRQIRYLEEWLGSELFIRGHRRVDLTPTGHRLYQSVHSSFTNISETVREISLGTTAKSINLYVTSSFARLWLIPRLNILRKQYPELHLNIISVEENPSMIDQFDVGITLGLEDDPGYQSDYLFSEEIFPVCTPCFYQKNPDAMTLLGLLQLPLLDLDAQFWKARWWSPIDWHFWLRQYQDETLQFQPEMTFSHYSLLLDAVLQDVGVGLAWHHLVQDMLADGRLIRPVSETYVASSRKHYFVCRNDLADSPEVLFLRSWLLEQTTDLRDTSEGR